MKKLIAGNWKMNGSIGEARVLTENIAKKIEENSAVLEKCDFLICPTFIHLPLVKRVVSHINAPLCLGAQDSAANENGAYTGEVSSKMLSDFGCEYVILGHSERRQYYGESDQLVYKKAELAHQAGLKTIICVGETEHDRDSGRAEEVVGNQIINSVPDGATFENTVIAYEPVWAIGTGNSATSDDVSAMHQFIREKMKEKLADFARIRILYGGSMKPENAKELLSIPNVDGGLIGGASLKAEQFLGIAEAVL
jgi:triosephosphate isomerase